MATEIPKLNLGFFKDGLRINSKKFDPLNMSFKGIKLESDKERKKADATDILEGLTSIDVTSAGSSDKVKVLKSMLAKVIP